MSISDPVRFEDFGGIGNSTGMGHGADDTLAIEAAFEFAFANKRSMAPSAKGWRITRPIKVNWTAAKIDFVGESLLQTIFYADFTSLVPCAAFMLDNPPGLRSYVGFDNFTIIGRRDPNVSGIFCNWTGSFSSIGRVMAYGLNHGFVIANDYYMKLRDCYAINNVSNGVMFGWHLDGASSPCNNVGIEGGIYTDNGHWGVAVTECRSLNIDGAAVEANGVGNIYLNKIYCGSVSPSYMEFDPNLPPVPLAQIYITNSEVVSVLASVSAFDLANNPVVWLAGNNKGVTVDICIESSAPGPLNATGVRVDSSKGVKIRGSFNGIVRGVTIDATSEVHLDGPVFTNVATPVIASSSAACVLRWSMAKGADVDASSIGALCDRRIDRIGAAPPSPPPSLATNERQSFAVIVNCSDLVGGGTKILVPSALSGGRWRILDIMVVGLTAFSGGDRGIAVLDGTHTWSVLPLAALATANFQARWGSVQVPFSATYWHMLQDTALGANLLACFTGGSADHTSGSVKIIVDAERVA